MDILFSPYGFGGMPKSAMAEVERRTEELLKSSSFQRMLELEKKHKMERLRGSQAPLPSPQLSGPPPRPERPDTVFPQEQFLMVKAARRTVVLPSLSITIPQPAERERIIRAAKARAEEEDEEEDDVGTPTNTEPFQKQVKFLAPEDDDDDGGEDGMSEQSSICQSPSWEGYGQRKKDKKREAERRKREKEHAEKEAKAARKRASARLSKPPPPPETATASRESITTRLTNADRSMSDPLLITRRPGQSTQPAHRPQDAGNPTSAGNLQHNWNHRPAVTEVLSASSSSDYIERRHDLRRSISEGPVPVHQQPSLASPSSHESHSPRGGLPPSASRTPMLRHMSPPGRNRTINLYQEAAEVNYSQESLTGPQTADADYRRGYVGHQRAQVTERAMAGLVDEQVARSAAHYYPPSRSSSGQTQHSRRSSLTQDAKAAAMKFVGLKPSSAAKDDNNSQTDYLTFKSIPYSASGSDASASMDGMPASLRGAGEQPSTSEVVTLHNKKGLQGNPPALERPSTSQSSASLSALSVFESARSTQGKKGRSLMDAAKAALSISKGSQGSTNSFKPSVPVSPCLPLRPRMHSRVSAQAENGASQQADQVPPTHTKTTSASDPVKSAELQPQTGYRASEGSSSSSAYEDGSPLLSPSTTPDTSRPQSAKDVPLVTGGISDEMPKTGELQDDERTLRQSLDSNKSSTPRMVDGEARADIELGHEDRWSRSALPIDIDFDAQSFMTTVSNFDNAEVTDQLLTNGLSAANTEKESREPCKGSTMKDLQAGDTEPAISIPPRSQKRGQTSPERSAHSPVATTYPGGRHEDEGTMQVVMGNLDHHGLTTETRWPPSPRAGRNYARPPDVTRKWQDTEDAPEGYTKHSQPQARAQEGGKVEGSRRQLDGATTRQAPGSPQQSQKPGSTSPNSPAVPSAGPRSPHALLPDFPLASRTYSADLTESPKYQGFSGETASSAGPPSPISLPSPLHQIPLKPPAQPRTNSAPTPLTASTATSRASTPSARASGIVPVSILKQPKNPSPDQSQAGAQTSSRPPALSALPKHMQLQAGVPARSSGTVAETRMAPLAKIFVECCSCKFYHDMPSKLYECMAKPDAVVEDRLLGISGAITTMVKCPWCQHNMSRNCCPGYAAVVYLKEKLH